MSNTHHHCQNCDAPLEAAFCKYCGQKASTHRISVSSFLQHDLVHGLFHVDKGILYTMRELLYRPGYIIRDYLAGKRVNQFNIITFLVLILAVSHFFEVRLADNEGVLPSGEKMSRGYELMLNEYYKITYLLMVPLLAAFSVLMFRRLKYNFAEHLVLSCYILTGCFYYELIFNMLEYVTRLSFIGIINVMAYALYPFVAYYQLSRGQYKFFGYLWRTILVIFLFMLVAALLMLLVSNLL